MNYITLDQLKKHLNLNEDFRDDDQYLYSLIKSSQEVVEKFIDQPLRDCEISDGKIPDSLRHAMLLFAANLYENRESTAPLHLSEVPHAFQFLLDLYQKY